MAQLIVRNLDPAIKAAISKRAASRGRSMEAEVRDILEQAVASDSKAGLGSRIHARFQALEFDLDIEEHRGSVAEPARLDD